MKTLHYIFSGIAPAELVLVKILFAIVGAMFLTMVFIYILEHQEEVAVKARDAAERCEDYFGDYDEKPYNKPLEWAGRKEFTRTCINYHGRH